MSALRPPTVRLRFRRRPINSTCFFFFFSSFTFGFSLQKRGLSISRIYEKKQKESLFRVITVDALFLSLMDPTNSHSFHYFASSFTFLCFLCVFPFSSYLHFSRPVLFESRISPVKSRIKHLSLILNFFE